MADFIDPQSREVKTNAEEMLKPTAPALKGMQLVVDKLTEKIEVLNKEASTLSNVIGNAVKSTSGLGDKIDELSKVMKARLDAAAAVKSGSKTSKKTVFTEEGLKKVLTEALKPSKELIEIHEKVISKHTIYVRDDRMFQATRVLISTVEALNAQMGGLIATRSTRATHSSAAAAASSAKHDDIIAAAEASGRVEPSATTSAASATASPPDKPSAADIDYKQFKFNATQSARSLGQTKGEWIEIIEAIEKSELIKTRTGKLDKKHVKQLALMSINSQRYSESQRKLIAKELEMIRLKQEEGKQQKEIDKSIEKLLKLLNSVNASVDLEKKLVARLRDEWFGTLKTVDEYKQAMEDATVQISRNIKTKIVAGLTAVPAALAAISGADKVFEGVLMNNAEFDKSLASIAYSKGEILDKTRDQVLAEVNLRQTGQREEVLHKALLKNTQKGFKEQKKTLSMTKEGVRLGTMIGADAEQTADFLGSWSQSMRMSVEQSKMFSRQLHTVGGITGVVGEDLLSAAKSSESITKNLRNLGRLDIKAAAGITQLLAEAKKGGVEGEMSDFASKMTSPQALQNDSKAFTLAMQAAQLGGVDTMKVRSGSGLSAGEDRRSMGQGMQAFLDQTLRGILTPEQRKRGVNFSNFKNEANADEIALKLDAILRSATDKSSGEIDALAKALIESGKTSIEVLEDIDQKLKNKNLASKERQSLTQQKERLTFNEFATHAAALSEAAGKDGEAGITAYLEDQKNREDLIADLERDGVQNARSMSTEELKQQVLNKIGADTSKPQDAVGIQDSIAEAMEKRGAKEVAERKDSNPFLKAEYEMRELNELISQQLAGPLKYIADWLGGYGIALVTAIGSIASGVGGGLISGLLGKLLGGGGRLLGGGGRMLLGGGGRAAMAGGSALLGGLGATWAAGGAMLGATGGVGAAGAAGVAAGGVAATAAAFTAMAAAAGAAGFGLGYLVRQIPGIEEGLESMGSGFQNWWDSEKVNKLKQHNKDAIAAVRAEEETAEYKEAQKRHKQTVSSYEELDKAILAGNKEAAKEHMKIILENTAKTGGGYESSLAQAKAAEVAKLAGPDAEQDALAEQVKGKARFDEIRDSLIYKYNSRGMTTINKSPAEAAAAEAHNRAVREEMNAEATRLAAAENLNPDGTYIKKPEPIPVTPPPPPVPLADTKLPANNEAAIEDKLRQERASGNKDSAGTAVAEGIGHVEENTKSTVEELQKLHIEMKQLVALFKNNIPTMNDSVSDMAKNDATSKRKPKSSTNFHQWQIARYSSNPAKGVTDNLV